MRFIASLILVAAAATTADAGPVRDRLAARLARPVARPAVVQKPVATVRPVVAAAATQACPGGKCPLK